MKDRMYLHLGMFLTMVGLSFIWPQDCLGQRTLAWKFPKAAEWKVSIEQDSNIRLVGANNSSAIHESTTTQKSDMTWRVLDVSPDGTAAIEQTMDRVVLQHKTARETIVIDTQEKQSLSGQAEMLAKMIRPLNNASFIVRTKTTGEILELRLSESTKGIGGPSESELKNLATQSACRFPEKPVQVGETWQSQYEIDMREIGKFLVQTTYLFVGDETIEGKTFSKLKSSTTMKLANPDAPNQLKVSRLESFGALWFDHQLGRMYLAETQQDFVFDVMQGGQTLKQEVKQKYRLRFSNL